MNKIVPVLLVGGSGERLWPLSRPDKPKQFLALFDDYSLFQSVLIFLKENNIYFHDPIIVSHRVYQSLIECQLKQINFCNADIILEPGKKNTAPAAARAAFYIGQKYDTNRKMLILPTDHVIKEKDIFLKSIIEAAILAEQGHIVTFGIEPREPKTQYGYIKRGPNLNGFDNAFFMERFIEKPSKEKAALLFQKKGDYFWNSGIFLTQACAYLDELSQFQESVHKYAKLSIETAKTANDNLIWPDESYDKHLPDVSIDYGIMEKTKKGVMLTTNMTWSDVGNWDEVFLSSQKNECENATFGKVASFKSSRNFIYSKDQLVATLGVNDLIVVVSDESILVANQKELGHMRDFVNDIKLQFPDEVSDVRQEVRPWGSYKVLIKESGFLVKRINVNPGKSISLQSHEFRSEHWVVVSGAAKVINGDDEVVLGVNESVYIPSNAIHRVTNMSNDMDLIIIETQIGQHLSESDIVRYKDDFNRETAKIV